MRHGCVHGMHEVQTTALEAAVKQDIEVTWTHSR
jgi:hypothetical protein